jgi:hypothetical protein
LNDGRVLLHNSDGRGCSPCGLWVAPSFDDIRDYEQIVDADSLDVFGTSDDFPIPYIHDMVEVSPGVIRFLISTFNATENTTTTVVADVNLSTASVTQIATIDPQAELYQPIFSADGRLLVGLTGVDYSADALVGWISMMDAETGDLRVLSDLPMVAAPLAWAQ